MNRSYHLNNQVNLYSHKQHLSGETFQRTGANTKPGRTEPTGTQTGPWTSEQRPGPGQRSEVTGQRSEVKVVAVWGLGGPRPVAVLLQVDLQDVLGLLVLLGGHLHTTTRNNTASQCIMGVVVGHTPPFCDAWRDPNTARPYRHMG